ncbi:MAG: response regulator [Peptococcaceae bacterium]|nr:response regulator [Peptococcaceae bacterium]
MKILITDDAKFMRLSLGNILRKAGYEIIEAESGVDALEKYRKNRPDLVTMDITMPEMDGVEAVKRIKEIDPGARVIMISALGQIDFVTQAIKNGALDFIVKPFKEDRVLEAVSRITKGVGS